MNKNRLFLVMQREYYAIVAKKSFIISTILVPILVLLIGVVPVLLSQFNSSDEAECVTIVDNSGKFAQAFEDDEDYRFVYVSTDRAESVDELRERYGDSYALIAIPADVSDTHKVTVYSDDAVRMSLMSQIEDVLGERLSQEKIESYGIPEFEQMMKDSHIDVDIDALTWDNEVSSTMLASVVGIVLAFIIYIFVLMFGAMIMASVVEDKTNRIVEVIVSSCRPIELMMGKIIGVALVGLTQIAIWAILLGAGMLALSLSGLVPDTSVMTSGAVAGMDAVPELESGMAKVLQMIMSINWVQLLGMFVVYFIGGYLLYAALFAGFGSAVDQQSDTAQFTTPVMMIIVFALLIGESCIENPNGQLGVWCSIIPFTSPIVMMTRLPYDVPFWQLLTSIGVLYASAILFTYFASRIYRNGILRYGKKVSYIELFRWLK
ncbi:MAG: ABC transporter permease [Muribaculum sp.]|nr:ABC transporter permease [Muribaculum sp.]